MDPILRDSKLREGSGAQLRTDELDLRAKPKALSAISCQGLSKVFGTKSKPFLAISELSFEVCQGESVAFLGPNGAGKSTAIKLMCGILIPTSGQVQLLSEKAGSKNALRNLGLVFGTRTQLWMNLSVFDSLQMTCEIYGIPYREQRERIQEGAQLFQVENLLPQLVRSLSLGQRMRCEIVAAILHQPKVLLLDEPTIGLDVVSKFLMRDLLLNWKEKHNTTLLLTSHDMSDVEKLCERVLLINKGKLEFDGNLAELKGKLGHKRRIGVWLNSPLHSSQIVIKPESASQPISTKMRIEKEGYVHLFECEHTELEQFVNSILGAYQGNIQDLKVEDIPLEEVMLERYSQ